MKTRRKKMFFALFVGLLVPVASQNLFATGQTDTEGAQATETVQLARYNEAPMLAEMVRAGTLPPVEERLPIEPLVIIPVDGIGKYGGTIWTVSSRNHANEMWLTRLENLMILDRELEITLNVAIDWELSSDFKTLTIFLREGHRWSNGDPFTADDLMFWYEAILSNDELTPVKPKEYNRGNILAQANKVDDYTVQFQFAEPNPSILPNLSRGTTVRPFAPGNYLKQFHINHNDQANDVAKESGHDNWWQNFKYHDDTRNWGYKDPERPVLGPWGLRDIDSTGNRYLIRNPYFFKIDPEGNQLPYADENATLVVENEEVVNLKSISGEVDYAGIYTRLDKYTLYKTNEEKGNYNTVLAAIPRGELGYSFNLNHKDPVLREIFQDLRFRQAMSLAIDRPGFNDTFFFGRGVIYPSLIMPPDSVLVEPWMTTHYMEHDPDKSNELLDEMGLEWDSEHRYRLRPDGKTLAINLIYAAIMNTSWQEYIAKNWEAVGVQVILKEVASSLFASIRNANELDVGNWALGSHTEFAAWQDPNRYRPPWTNGSVEWGTWYTSGGNQGEEPPEEIKELFDLGDAFQRTLKGTDEYTRLGRELMTRHVRGLYTIGTVALIPYPLIMSNRLKNGPKEGDYYVWDFGYWTFLHPEQWYIDE